VRRFLDSNISVSGQIQPGQMAELAAGGVTLVICNRPEQEEPGQPSHADLRRAAEASGLRFVTAPFQGRPTPEAIECMTEALAGDDNIHAFCRSGMRSASTWAVSEVRRGRPVDEVLAAGREAGYDLTSLFT